MLKLFRSKIYIALSLVLFVSLIGVLGFRLLSDYSWLDAVYMTVITMTTVGFSEVSPLDDAAKIFTIFLIISSVFIFAFALSVVTEYILGRNSLEILKKKQVKNKLQVMNKHVIVCGYGRNGAQAVARLKAYNKPFVVIENDPEVIEKYEDEVLFIKGDANEDEVLEAAGIHKAQYLICTLPSDAANLFVVLSARQLNTNLFIISRASEIGSEKKLSLAGANKVIMPDRIGGDHMASLVVIPDLITFMDKLSTNGKKNTNLEEIAIERFAGSSTLNSLRDLDLRKRTGCTIIGYITPEGDYIINPDADLVLSPQGKLIVLGRPEQIEQLNKMCAQ